ncbi:hypothetical protein LCGC14_1788020 [marine sediment metagenome]|uniref:AP2/ERF domain-containing protein n=1 Tax=marine sediment metagenome TaxID=412755 RepID=A0A0F9GTC7_9ZZZZ
MDKPARKERLSDLAGKAMTIINVTATKRLVFKQKPTDSKYKGVYLRKDGRKKKWRAYIKYNKKPRHIGYFYEEKDAAIAFDKVHREVHGKIGMINRDIYPEDFEQERE